MPKDVYGPIILMITVSDQILRTQSREFRRVSSLRIVPVRFVPLPFIVLTFLFPLYYMSSGPQTAGDVVVLKFNMHVYTSVLTPNEVKNLVAEYAIPFDLHPCVPPSGLTMNRLPVDKIAAASMSEFLKFPMAGGVRVGKRTALTDNERVVEYENERVLAAKRKAQAAKDRAAAKRSAAEGTSRHTKKKKAAPMTFTLDDSEEDDSTSTGSGTHHSASPLNIIIPDDANPVTGEGGVALESVRYKEGDADHGLENAEEGTEADLPPATHHPRSQRSYRSEEDTHAHSTELRRDVGDERITNMLLVLLVTCSFWAEAAQPSLFVLDWKLKTHSILNDAESCRLSKTQNQLVDVIRGRNKLADDYKHLQQEHLGCACKEAVLVDKLAAVEKEKDDNLDKNRAQEEWIKRLEEELASKSSSLIEAKGSVSELKGDLERLTVDLSQVKIVRHNYVRQLLYTAF
nr:hypothetical protein [Tanacetum cinerariifolium]